MCKALYSFLDLFRQSYELVGSTEQNLAELEYALQLSEQVCKDQEGWATKLFGACFRNYFFVWEFLGIVVSN